MVALTICKLSNDACDAPCLHSAASGRGTAAEISAVLKNAEQPIGRIKLGSLLVNISQKAGGVDLDVTREHTPTEPIDLA